MNKQAKEILKIAEAQGVKDNFFFVNTFKNYLRQLEYLDQLDKSLQEDGVKVTKEYVKGRKNLYSHPALSDFNRTNDSANKSVATLIKIIKAFGNGEEETETDPLLDILNGGEADD